MTNLGYVGLGVMGGQMVDRLLDKGMKWADSPRAVCQAADVIISMVTNSDALDQIASGPNGMLEGLSAGKVWVEMSTGAPGLSRNLAGRVREKGADMVDAPVSGSVITLQQGKLS